jgi:signal transduction histidine kinase
VKLSAAAITLPDLTWLAHGQQLHMDLAIGPVGKGPGHVSAVLLTAFDRSSLVAARNEHAALRAEHERLSAEHAVGTEELQTLNEELRTTNDELRRRVQQLEAAEEADTRKNHFLAMLAHELRNPLAAAVNALHVIRKVAGTDRQINQALRIADRQLRHEARLIDDLLDVSRIVVGKVKVERRPVDVRECVRTAAETVDFAVQSRALRVSVHLSEEPLIVGGDATRLEQCVGNLLSNAVKFTPAGGAIEVGARAEGGDAVVTVRDSGVGIAPELIERVFDLFMQAESSLVRSQGGLGIGLTLVRRLVELHGGTVAARSGGPGRGSEFEIRLPLTSDAAVASELEADRPTPRLRVLIVEDNRDAREMLRAVLQMAGHVVWDTGDSLTGVRMAAEQMPDVVLVDIGLPEVDGFEVAQRIRRRLGDGPRLIALSGYGDDDTRLKARAAGFDAHIVKPVPPETLVRALGAR